MILENMLNQVAVKLAINIVVYLCASIITFLIFFFSYKTYKLTKERKYLYFSLGFILLSLGLVCHSIGNIMAYLGVERCFSGLGCNLPEQSLFLVHFGYVVLTFFAYTGLILIYSKAKDRRLVYFVFLQSFLLAWLTYATYLFNVVGFLFMLFISYATFRRYLSNKNRSTLSIFAAFSLIGLSHILFIFNVRYVGYASLFLGYLTFLSIFKCQNLSKTKNKL